MSDNQIKLPDLFSQSVDSPEAADLKFFCALMEASGPSGFETPSQRVYLDFVRQYADEVTTDVHGNVVAMKRGTGAKKVMVVGHADEIGLMINHIDSDGYLYVAAIGGVDPVVLPALRVDVHHEGAIVRGVIGRKAIHVLKPDEREKAPKLSDLWIDIGVTSREEAEKLVSVGDVVTFPKGVEPIGDDLLTSKATDNKCGVYLAAMLLKELHGEQINATLYSVSATMEEVGSRGAQTSAYGINPDVAIAIDVGNVSDIPGSDKKRQGDIALRKGPAIAVGATLNPVVVKRLKDAAKKLDIAIQIEPSPRYSGTDADNIQVVRSGVPCGLVSIPNRYMHTPSEVICWRDLQNAVKIVAEFVRALDDEADFRPLV